MELSAQVEPAGQWPMAECWWPKWWWAQWWAEWACWWLGEWAPLVASGRSVTAQRALVKVRLESVSRCCFCCANITSTLRALVRCCRTSTESRKQKAESRRQKAESRRRQESKVALCVRAAQRLSAKGAAPQTVGRRGGRARAPHAQRAGARPARSPAPSRFCSLWAAQQLALRVAAKELAALI